MHMEPAITKTLHSYMLENSYTKINLLHTSKCVCITQEHRNLLVVHMQHQGSQMVTLGF